MVRGRQRWPGCWDTASRTTGHAGTEIQRHQRGPIRLIHRTSPYFDQQDPDRSAYHANGWAAEHHTPHSGPVCTQRVAASAIHGLQEDQENVGATSHDPSSRGVLGTSITSVLAVHRPGQRLQQSPPDIHGAIGRIRGPACWTPGAGARRGPRQPAGPEARGVGRPGTGHLSRTGSPEAAGDGLASPPPWGAGVLLGCE